jgi:hypothetical protein
MESFARCESLFSASLHLSQNHRMASSADATSRPARRQVAKDKVLGPTRGGVNGGGGKPGQTYNIYYDKWTGGTRSSNQVSNAKEKSPYRCDPAKDAGVTKGTYNPNAYFCAFFAKGCCPHGYVYTTLVLTCLYRL